MTFRFAGKKVFLTYPQCGELTKDDVRTHLTDTLGCQWYLVASERHEDGGNHIHAYGEWNERFETRNERAFDVAGYHPNVQPARSKRAVLKYVAKDGNTIGNIQLSGPATVNYGELIERSRGTDDLIREVVASDPRRAVFGLERLKEFGDYWYGRPDTRYEPPDGLREFTVPEPLTEWVRDELPKTDRPKTLVLIGPSRTGKTMWARSLGDHNYFNGTWNWREFDENKSYTIFDDVDFKFFGPYWKQFFGAQRQFTVNPKYGKRRTIKWGKPSIWLSNRDGDPRLIHSRGTPEYEWLSMNCVFVDIYNPLFN